ncbi:hypothetical protein D3C76_423420 [compost metagenome]
MRYEVKVQIETVGEELLHVTLSSEDMESMTVFVMSNIAGKLAREKGYGRFKGVFPVDAEVLAVKCVFQKSRRRIKPNGQL